MVAAILTGDLVTDAVRALGVEGDGRTSDSSVGIYPTRRNLHPNSGAEQDTRYVGGTLASVSRQTDHIWRGSYGFRATVQSPGGTAIIAQTAIVSAPLPQVSYTHRVFIWGDATTIGKTAKAYFLESGGVSVGEISSNIVTVKVLAAGWNDLRVTAPLSQSDRTRLSSQFQLEGMTTADIFDFDAFPAWGLAYAPPYVEASEVLTPYDPSPNYWTDATYTTSYTPTNATSASSSLNPHAGTKSRTLVATNTSQASLVGNVPVAGFGGSTVPQVPIGISRWVYATGTVVGKVCRMAMIVGGGATATAVLANVGQVVAEGFNYLFMSATPDTADRTGLSIQWTIESPQAGDTVYISDVKVGRDYVAPTPATVTRSAGRIQLPMNGMSAAQGWIGLTVRPAWSTTPISQPGRPDLPLTLWRWADDADNALTLTFDGGLATITRTGNGGSDTASAPWAPERDTTSLIVAAWDATGVYVSVEGRALVGPFATIASDDFNRADTTSGLGTTPVGSKTWSVGGASLPRITSGKYTPHPSTGGTGYAYLDLGQIPARVGGLVSYLDGGSGGAGNHTLACANALGSLTDLLHLFLNQNSANYQWRESNGVFNNYRGAVLSPAITTDGTPASVMMTLQGDTLAITQNGMTQAYRHESIARLSTRYVFWEVSRANGATGMAVRWESIQADRYGSWSGNSSHIPTISASHADIGSNGDGTGHVGGDVLWAAMGRGTITDEIVATLDALGTTDPVRADFPRATQSRLVWPAEDDAVVLFPVSSTVLGDGDVRRTDAQRFS